MNFRQRVLAAATVFACFASPMAALAEPSLSPIAALSGDGPAGKVDAFGASITTDENWLFVGAPRELSSRGRSDGAVYIYRRQANGAYQRTQRISGTQTSSDNEGDAFGSGVAVSNGWLFVGVGNNQRFPGMVDPRGGTPPFAFAGKVFVYRLNAATSQWEFKQELISPQPGQNGAFGARRVSNHIAIGDNADIVVIGEPVNNVTNATSRMHVFARQGATWALKQSIDVASDRPTASPPIDFFLTADSIVALPGDRFAVKVLSETLDANGDPTSYGGEIRIFERRGQQLNPTPAQTIPVQPVPPSDCQVGGALIGGMAAGGNFFAAAQPCVNGAAGAGVGRVDIYAFNRNPNTPILTINSSFEGVDPQYQLGSSFDGQESISLDGQGRQMLVGAARDNLQGADVWLYRRSGADPWRRAAQLQPADPNKRFSFGQTVVFGHPSTGLAFVGQSCVRDVCSLGGPEQAKGAVHVYAIPEN